MDNGQTPTIKFKKLHLVNFKNFEDLEIELDAVNIIVGTNASGKSNICDSFRFLNGIGHGFTIPAILGLNRFETGKINWQGIRGGSTEIAFRNSSKFTIEAIFETVDGELTYSIQVELKPDIQIIQESLYLGGKRLFDIDKNSWQRNIGYPIETWNIKVAESSWIEIPYKERLKPLLTQINSFEQTYTNSGNFIFTNQNQFLTTPTLDKPTISITPEYLTEKGYSTENINKLGNERLLHGLLLKYGKTVSRFLSQMRFPDFDLNLMRAASFPGQNIFDNGSNLSSALFSVSQNNILKSQFIEWIHRLTPMDIQDFDFFHNEIGEIRLQLVEKSGQKISAFSASDGTLRFLGLLSILLNSDPTHLYIFEELEQGIHPARQYLLLQLIQEVTSTTDSQAFITTHSPSMLNFIDEGLLEHAYLLYRLENYTSSKIKRIVDIPDAKRLATTRGLARLHESGWFENVLYFDEEDNAEETLAIIAEQ